MEFLSGILRFGWGEPTSLGFNRKLYKAEFESSNQPDLEETEVQLVYVQEVESQVQAPPEPTENPALESQPFENHADPNAAPPTRRLSQRIRERREGAKHSGRPARYEIFSPLVSRARRCAITEFVVVLLS